MMEFIIINICMEIKLKWQTHFLKDSRIWRWNRGNVEQMSKDVTTFLMWTAEPHLEARHQMGLKQLYI